MLKNFYPYRQLKFVHTAPFERLSDIMHLHSRHLMHTLLRMGAFSRAEYECRSIPASALTATLTFGLLSWTTISLGLAIFMQWLPAYSEIMGSALGVSHYARFSLIGTTTFLLMEYLWYCVFSQLMVDQSRRYPPLELIFEYQATLDAEIGGQTRSNLIFWYNRLHRAVLLYLHLVWSAIGAQTAVISWLVLRHYLQNKIWLLEVPLYIFLAWYSHFLGAFSVVISSTFYTDLFFLVKIFKYKLVKCFTLLQTIRQSSPMNPLALWRFNFAYMHLHRQLNLYNLFSQKLIYMCDLVFKCAGSITFSFLAAEEGGGRNSTSLLITAMFLVSYAGLQLLFTYLAYFPAENLRAFKEVAGVAAKSAIQSHTSQCHNGSISIRSLLKLNGLVQFLAKNKFAFTYTSHYCIQKTNIIENVFANFYFLTLFYRKFV